jgi:hypothetical protein
MEDLLYNLDLYTINGYRYFSSLVGGQASTSLIYYNSEKKDKIVVKLLISPRNELELARFKEEVQVLTKIEKIQLGLNRTSSVPSLNTKAGLIIGNKKMVKKILPSNFYFNVINLSNFDLSNIPIMLPVLSLPRFRPSII